MSNNSLSKNAIRFLRGISHDLKPYVTVADKGLSENVMLEINTALDHHELIKIKLRTDRETRKELEEKILQQVKAQHVQSIGQTLTIFRRNPKSPVYELPK